MSQFKQKKLQAPVELPSKPSELIKLAIKDLKAAEKSKKYVVKMSRFHELVDDGSPLAAFHDDHVGKCAVCFAGSVMARSLKCNPKDTVSPTQFDKKTMAKLYALDALRLGDIPLAFNWLKLKVPKYLSQFHADGKIETDSNYSYPDKFKANMLTLANDLAEIGL